MSNKLNKGFTLIELIIVIAIIGILVAVLAPNYIQYVAKAHLSANKANYGSVSGKIPWHIFYFRSRRASAIFSTGNHQKSDGQTFAQMLLLMKRKTFEVSGKCSPDIIIFCGWQKYLFEKETREAYMAQKLDTTEVMKKSRGFFSEFKEFITKGNVMDMAVGVIIGAAFQNIINSLVNDIIMPIISKITGGIDFTNWFISLDGSHYKTLAQAQKAGAATLNYGTFLTYVINFILMALVIFVMVKCMNKLRATVEKEKEAPAPDTKECPYCMSKIPVKATRCPYCTSQLEK